MAETAAADTNDPHKELTAEANARLKTCEDQKREYNLDIREGYFFTAPHRARTIRSAQPLSPTKPDDAATLQTGIAMELSKDFATVAVNSFMPPAEPWAEQRPGMFLDDAQKKLVSDEIQKQDTVIFDAIRASNLYEEIPKSFNPDLAIGTAAIHISDPRPHENMVVQAIPLHELEINVGPFGSLDDRFVVRHTKNHHVRALLGEEIYGKLPDDCRKKIESTEHRDEATIVRWGYWRLWADMSDVVWQHVVMLDTKVVHEAKLRGEGSCPLIPMRFNPSPEWAFGNGPTIECLPDFRSLDDIEGKKMAHIDLTLAPPFTYPDDSSTAWGELESGKGYPVRPGTADDVKNIFDPGSMQPAIYEVDEKERSCRHRHFLDWPEQRGDTPPTATQWLDEMQMAQRRFGTPGASFWREGPAEIFLRFKFLLTQRQVIKPIQVDGKTVSLQPYNPAQRAAEQQEVAMAARYLSIVGPTWPEEFRLKVDGGETMENIAKKMRVTGLVSFRSKEQMGNVLDGIKQLAEGRQQVRPGDPAAVGQL